jgi:methionyl-tRNA formyltransferase
VLFAGSPEVAVPSLEALLAAGHEVAAVATKPDAFTGRGRVLTPSAVALAAADKGIPVLRPVRASEPEFIRAVRELGVEVAVVVAWGALVPDVLLGVPQYGWVNAHFSLLPAYRGAAPVQRALIDNQQETGVTTFRLVAEMDAGPVFRQLRTEIGDTENAGELLERLSQLAAGELVATLADIAAGVQPTPQPSSGITLAPKLTVADTGLDWSQPDYSVRGLIRGANPNPGAWTLFRGQRLKVLRATVVTDDHAPLAPGELAPSKHALLVGCGAGGALRLDAVQAVGKAVLTGADWARGTRVVAGECFE